MTEKRFKWVFIKDNELEFQDNGIVKRFENYRLEEFLNELNDENQQMKSNGLNVLHFYENKLKNSKRKDFQSVRDEIWIVKQVLYEMGILDD